MTGLICGNVTGSSVFLKDLYSNTLGSFYGFL